MALTFRNIQDQSTMDTISGMKGAEAIQGGYRVPSPTYGAPVPAPTASPSRIRPVYNPEPAPTQPEWQPNQRDDNTQRFTMPGSSFGGSSSSSDYSSTTQWNQPGDPMPTVSAGQFNAPEFDDRQVSKYSQQFAAPNIRRLRDQVQAALSSPEDNPNVGALKKRGALAGYGQGLENVMAGAYGQALTKYNQEYSRSYNEQMTNFNADENAKRNNFQAAINSWMKRGSTTTARTSNTSSGSGAGGGNASPGFSDKDFLSELGPESNFKMKGDKLVYSWR